MRKIVSIFFVLLIVGGLAYPVAAQKAKLKRADRQFDRLNYSRAIELYSMIANRNFKKVSVLHVTERLA